MIYNKKKFIWALTFIFALSFCACRGGGGKGDEGAIPTQSSSILQRHI